MDILTVKKVKVEGVTACLPENIVDNREFCKDLYGSGIETLIKATGIESRCIANEGTTALDLDITAAKHLLNRTNTATDEIGAVICVSFTPEYRIPGDAAAAQFRLGLPNHIVAFDLNMACSGYGYGLYLAGALASSLQKKVLLLNGDVQSTCVSDLDKATMPVLADIGTATILAPSDQNNVWKFSFFSNGERGDVLRIPAGGGKNPTKAADLEYIEYEDGSKRRNLDLYMDGFEVFKFVALEASKFINEFMEKVEMTPESINAFVPHQANIYMITQLTKKLKIPINKMWKSGNIFGNPASASVPLTIAKNVSEWITNGKGFNNILLSGFGAGLSISAGLIDLNVGGVYDIVKYGE